MKYSILVMRIVGKTPPHIHLREHGIRESKIDERLRAVAADEYERLERGKPVEYLVDMHHPEYGVLMSRLLDTGTVVTAQIIKTPDDMAEYFMEHELEGFTRAPVTHIFGK